MTEGEGVRHQIRGALILRSEAGPDGHLVRLSGELDLAAAELLKEEVARLSNDDDRMIVLDLSDLDFIDSTGIHLLLELEASSRSDGERLRMIRGSGAVQRVLELTGADERLPYLHPA